MSDRIALDPAAARRLREIVGDRLLTDPADCWSYGYDNSRHHRLPAAVAFPLDHAEVAALVTCCFDQDIPIVPRGRGTATTGAAVPLRHGLVISFERMDRILRIDPDNRLAVVEPGLTNQALQDVLSPTGFFWPPDPTSAPFCSIGGNLACNAAGPRAVKYGTPRDNVLGLRAVTGAGGSIRTGVYTTKGVVGYDLTRLIIGSEGTLAVITQATLKLTPKPQAKRTLRATYADVAAAAQAVARIMAQPVTPCALEFMDDGAVALVREYADLPADAGAVLMIEVDGPAELLDFAVQAVSAAAAGAGLVPAGGTRSRCGGSAVARARRAVAGAAESRAEEDQRGRRRPRFGNTDADPGTAGIGPAA